MSKTSDRTKSIVDSPDYYRPSTVNSQAKENINKDQWTNVKDQYMLSPILGGDGRLIILEDPFKSQYDCVDCGGVGYTKDVCPSCIGTKMYKGKEENGECPHCLVGSTLTHACGRVPCNTCKGRGGTLVIPDESKRNTTTGNVIAVSEHGIKHVKVGNKVMFTNYTGSPFKILSVDLRIVVEKDLLCIVKQLKPNAQGLNEGTFAELDNIGVAHE